MEFPTLPIEYFDENGLQQSFYVNQFSKHLEQHHAHILHPHAHDFYICILFTHGTGTHTVDFASYPIQPGALFFLQPEHVHYWSFDGAVEGWIFFHSASFYRLHHAYKTINDWQFFKSKNTIPFVQLESPEITQFSNYFLDMYFEYQRREIFGFTKIAALQQLIYVEAARIYAREYLTLPQDETHYHSLFRCFEDAIEEHFTKESSPQFYADLLAISTKHLHRVAVRISGKNPTKIIAERIILEAKRFIVLKEQSLDQIAFELGFENYPYFTRFFKKHCGITPKQFRKASL